MDAKTLKELQTLLDEADLPVAWAARRIGITPGYLGVILKGRVGPSEAVKDKINVLVGQLQRAGLSRAS